MYVEIKSCGQNPPDHKFNVGQQNDGSGQYYAIIANTPHGRLPGKGKCGRGWYSFGGKEHETKDFHFLMCNPGYDVHLQKSMSPPTEPGAVRGTQRDRGTLYSVLCEHTGHGRIPGKSDGRTAWYSWGGKEHETRNFSYVIVRYNPPQSAYPTPCPPPYYPPAQPYYLPAQPSYPSYTPGYPPPYTPAYPPSGAGTYVPPTPAYAPEQGFTEGMLVRFRCTKTNKTLRILGNGVVDGMGGQGKFATFRVHVLGPGRYTFQNQDGKFLAVKYSNCCACIIFNDPDTMFMMHLNTQDRSVSLECQTHPGWFMAVKRDGTPKLIFADRKPATRFFPQIA